jgi:hypothetical protein
VSARLLSSRPEAVWLWVEGDDRRIRWSDLPALFTRFEYDSRILEGSDGFVRLARTPSNLERLALLQRTAPLSQ